MEHISLISHNKKGVSMAELIAYVALYGVVMSLLASLVFVIIQAARKVNNQAILNRGATIMYTEILSQTIALDADTVNDVEYKDASGNVIADPASNKESIDTVSVTFMKKWSYATTDGEQHVDETGATKTYNTGERYPLENPSTIKYVYKKGTDNIDVIRNGDEVNKTSINLDFKMTLTSVDDNNIYNCIQVNKQNTSNKYVTFNGYLHFDNKKMEFNFIIPVFVANVS